MFIMFLFTLLLSTNAFAAETQIGLSNESEAGLVVTGGNAESESYSVRQLSRYQWEHDVLRFDGKFLSASSRGVESARNWLLGLRYERSLVESLSFFAGQSLESDVFAGFVQRYNTDAGAKYYFIKEEALTFFLEGGYRYAVENRFAGQLTQSLLRLFTEASRDWTKTFSTRVSIEYLPNLTIAGFVQLNTELSASAALSEIFALKTGYTLRYRKIPVAPATRTTDTQFTTALVAKF